MNRREVMAGGTSLALGGLQAGHSVEGAGAFALPTRPVTKVAFVIGDGANVIDTAGPWEVFQDFPTPGGGAFDLFTVAPSMQTVTMTGGLRIDPQFTVDDAPIPHVVVVPAQPSRPELMAWVKSKAEGADMVISICDGAFFLADAGMLDGLSATTHHAGVGALARRYPAINVKRGVRFVDNGKIATSAGLTSGIDLALHVVARYHGPDQAQQLAEWIEHRSQDWRSS